MLLRIFCRKLLAALLSILVPTGPLLAQISETNIWMERKGLQQKYSDLNSPIACPIANNDDVVIHIQDVHANEEAQKFISDYVSTKLKTCNVSLIAIEGAFAPIDLSRYKAHPNQESIRKVADFLLRKKAISGVIHSVLTHKGVIPPIIGVDDRTHYKANVEAYQSAAVLIDTINKNLSNEKDQILIQKKLTLNNTLYDFDSKVELYRGGRIPLSSYVRLLKKNSTMTLPQTQAFLNALQKEESLNIPKVESERTRLLDALVRTLNKTQSDELMNSSRLFRERQSDHSLFYDQIAQLCIKHRIALDNYPAMKNYIDYLHLTNAISSKKLFIELRQLEDAIYSKLIHSPNENELIKESRQLYLLDKLVKFSLTRDEWQEFKEDSARPSIFRPFENFYREAEARDTAMTKNLLNSIGNLSGMTILVTGGFHSEAIDHNLKEAGYHVITVKPRISMVDTKNGGAYLSVFAQEKAPLEKLFDGEKLFLAEPQWTPAIVRRGGLAFVADREGNTSDFISLCGKDSGPLLVDAKKLSGESAIAVEVKNGETDQKLFFRYHVTPEKIDSDEQAEIIAIPHSILYNGIVFLGRMFGYNNWHRKFFVKIIGLIWVPIEVVLILDAMYTFSPTNQGLFILGVLFFDFYLGFFAHTTRGAPKQVAPLFLLRVILLGTIYLASLRFLDTWEAFFGITFSQLVIDTIVLWWRELLINWGPHYPWMNYDSESKAFIMDGLLRRQPRTLINDKTFQTRPDETPLLSPEDLKPEDFKLYEQARQKLMELKKLIGSMYSSQIADDVFNNISIVGVFAETRLLVNEFLSPRYRWGFLRPSRGRPVVFIPIKKLASLHWDTDKKLAASALVYGHEWIKTYAQLTIENKDEQQIHYAMKEFNWIWTKREINLITSHFLLRHTLNCLVDYWTLFWLEHKLKSDFDQLKFQTNKLQMEIENILNMPEYISSDNETFLREEAVKKYLLKREEIVPLQQRLENLSYRAMGFGNYEMALSMMRWGDYLCAIDVGILPMTRYLTMLRVMARTRRYNELREGLLHLEKGEIPIRIKNKEILIKIDPAELDIFIHQALAKDFGTWLYATLTRQAQIVNDDDNRQLILQVRQECLALFNQIIKKTAIKKNPPLNFLGLSGSLPFIIFATSLWTEHKWTIIILIAGTAYIFLRVFMTVAAAFFYVLEAYQAIVKGTPAKTDYFKTQIYKDIIKKGLLMNLYKGGKEVLSREKPRWLEKKWLDKRLAKRQWKETGIWPEHIPQPLFMQFRLFIHNSIKDFFALLITLPSYLWTFLKWSAEKPNQIGKIYEHAFDMTIFVSFTMVALATRKILIFSERSKLMAPINFIFGFVYSLMAKTQIFLHLHLLSRLETLESKFTVIFSKSPKRALILKLIGTQDRLIHIMIWGEILGSPNFLYNWFLRNADLAQLLSTYHIEARERTNQSHYPRYSKTVDQTKRLGKITNTVDENIWGPINEELKYSLIPFFLFGIPGLLIARIIYIVRHQTGPPLRSLTAPFLISTLPLIFIPTLFITPFSLFQTAFLLQTFIIFLTVHIVINFIVDGINFLLSKGASTFALRKGSIEEIKKGLKPGSDLLLRYDKPFETLWDENLINKPATREFATKLLQEQQQLFNEMNMAWMNAHAKGVTVFSQLIGKVLLKKGLITQDELNNLFVAVLFHDLGKTAVDSKIWNKETPLTEEERIESRVHVTQAEVIFQSFFEKHSELITRIKDEKIKTDFIKEIARSHHERLNGSGYPLGLKGQDVSILLRIVMIADFFEAHVGLRPYSSVSSTENAITLLENMGNQGYFDKEIVQVLRQVQPEIEAILHPSIALKWLTGIQLDAVNRAIHQLSDIIANAKLESGEFNQAYQVLHVLELYLRRSNHGQVAIGQFHADLTPENENLLVFVNGSPTTGAIGLADVLFTTGLKKHLAEFLFHEVFLALFGKKGQEHRNIIESNLYKKLFSDKGFLNNHLSVNVIYTDPILALNYLRPFLQKYSEIIRDVRELALREDARAAEKKIREIQPYIEKFQEFLSKINHEKSIPGSPLAGDLIPNWFGYAPLTMFLQFLNIFSWEESGLKQNIQQSIYPEAIELIWEFVLQHPNFFERDLYNDLLYGKFLPSARAAAEANIKTFLATLNENVPAKSLGIGDWHDTTPNPKNVATDELDKTLRAGHRTHQQA